MGTQYQPFTKNPNLQELQEDLKYNRPFTYMDLGIRRDHPLWWQKVTGGILTEYKIGFGTLPANITPYTFFDANSNVRIVTPNPYIYYFDQKEGKWVFPPNTNIFIDLLAQFGVVTPEVQQEKQLEIFSESTLEEYIRRIHPNKQEEVTRNHQELLIKCNNLALSAFLEQRWPYLLDQLVLAQFDFNAEPDLIQSLESTLRPINNSDTIYCKFNAQMTCPEGFSITYE